MTQLDIELAALRTRRTPRFSSWLRTLAIFDRRAIREPGERDAYWERVQGRLAQSDARVLLAGQSGDPVPKLLASAD